MHFVCLISNGSISYLSRVKSRLCFVLRLHSVSRWKRIWCRKYNSIVVYSHEGYSTHLYFLFFSFLLFSFLTFPFLFMEKVRRPKFWLSRVANWKRWILRPKSKLKQLTQLNLQYSTLNEHLFHRKFKIWKIFFKK